MPTPAAHIWRPSSARVIVLDGFTPLPRGTTQTVPASLNWPAKDPGDTLDYQLDYSLALAGDDTDAIATLDVVITPNATGDLVLSNSAGSGSAAVLWLTSGQVGTIYTVVITVGTLSGRIISRSVLLPVLALAAASTVNDLTTDSGSVLTDQNGNPITLG
ncbi:MAG TPA: hypothetical protein VME92_12195 [Acetobacteraceae bacterium]|nr:hypothetical protein [Acetobacteraceae bacterium]